MTPDYELIVDGSSITRSIRETNRLIELEIIDKRNLEADQLSLTLSDHDQTLALPPTGGIIQAAIGFSPDGFADSNIAGAALSQIGLEKGDFIAAGLALAPEVEFGLIDKGQFIIDTIEYSGPPNIITISASSADFRESLKSQREQSYDEVSFGDIATAIAARNNLKPAIDGTIGANHVTHIDQTNESDANFMVRLAKKYGGIALFKNGFLTIVKANEPATSSGLDMPEIDIDLSQVDVFHYSDADRNARYTGARAYWVDRNTGEKMAELAGSNGYIHTVQNTAATQEEAQQLAKARLTELKAQQKTLTIDLATGRPRFLPNSPVKLTGFNQSVANIGWLSTQITHNISDSGYVSSVQCEPLV